MTANTTAALTASALETACQAARAAADAAWEKACAWQGIAPKGAFLRALSAENPFRAETEATRAAHRAAYIAWREAFNAECGLS